MSTLRPGWQGMGTAPHDGTAVWVQSQCYAEEGWAYYHAAGHAEWRWCEGDEEVDPGAEVWWPNPPEGAPARPTPPFGQG